MHLACEISRRNNNSITFWTWCLLQLSCKYSTLIAQKYISVCASIKGMSTVTFMLECLYSFSFILIVAFVRNREACATTCMLTHDFLFISLIIFNSRAINWIITFFFKSNLFLGFRTHFCLLLHSCSIFTATETTAQAFFLKANIICWTISNSYLRCFIFSFSIFQINDCYSVAF